MPKKKIAIEDLAQIIAQGFQDTATKADINDLRGDIREINRRLDRIEQVILADYGRRIERIEDALALPKAS